jgi:uncharacterized membrane protein SirB2
MIDRFFSRAGIGLALTFMVTELAYINQKSLYYLVDGKNSIDVVFSIIGALAFSIVTVVIMRKSDNKIMKLIFPVFDTLLVFCGFNLRHAYNIINGTDNPIRFWLTVFMGIFTGFIVYGLGIINYKEQTENTRKKDQDRINELIGKLHQVELTKNELAAKLQQVESNKKNNDAELQQIKSALQQKEILLQQTENKLQQLAAIEKQIAANCTCEYCNRIFVSEAAKRSHAGKCPEKTKNK